MATFPAAEPAVGGDRVQEAGNVVATVAAGQERPFDCLEAFPTGAGRVGGDLDEEVDGLMVIAAVETGERCRGVGTGPAGRRLGRRAACAGPGWRFGGRPVPAR
ncbi:hypothetical protein [Candidatus Frankia alpina]|uniref:hypothetical protein n=1 Tax=Candidatus Frankia alpina TaxID=2699483 RepID=UPI0013D0BE01|nr:hypothetical protein [Candidatus Frankia alpina]